MIEIKQKEVMLTGGDLLLVSEKDSLETPLLCMLVQVSSMSYKIITMRDGNRYFEDNFSPGPLIALEEIRSRYSWYRFTPVKSATLTYEQ